MAEQIISPGVFTRENDISFITPAPIDASSAFIGPTVKGPVEQPTVVTSFNQYKAIYGDTFASASVNKEFLTSIAVKNFFQQGGNSALVTRVVSASQHWTSATSTVVTASHADAGAAKPFTLKTHGQGAIYNNSTGLHVAGLEVVGSGGSLKTGTKDNIRWEVTNKDNNNGTFTLAIRRGNDNHNNKVVLEQYTNVSLDPNSDNYIESVIGNQTTSVVTDGSLKYVKTSGNYVNKSNYVFVSAVGQPTIDYLAADGFTVNKSATNSYSASLPAEGSGSFHGAVGSIVKASMNFNENISNTDTQGLIAADYSDAILILQNKDEYVINVMAAPGLIYDHATHGTVLDTLVSAAETRSDCIAIVDLVDYGSTTANVVVQGKLLNSSYAASYWPWVQLSGGAGIQWAPASCVVPGVYAFNDSAAAPWFAPAGLVRGGITGVVQAEQKLSRTQRDTVYAGKVNPIATFPGQGIAVFGQKTLQTKASALDRVNVRRLLIALKKFLGDQATNLVFEQNTIATRNRFLANVNPYLESVVQRQGLYAYRVVMDDTNNTADVVDRNQLVGQVFIQPAKTAEFIVLDFTIEPTGATFA
jgi:hypothetical protein